MRSVLPYLLFNRILFFVFSHIRSKRLWGNPFRHFKTDLRDAIKKTLDKLPVL